MNPLLEHLTVRVALANVSELNRSWQSDAEFCPETKVYLPLCGSAYVAWNGVRHDIGPGRMMLVPPGTPLEYALTGPRMDILWAHLDARLMGVLRMADCVPTAWSVVAEPEDTARLRRLVALFGASGDSAQLEAQGLAMQLLSRFILDTYDPGAAWRRDILWRFEPVFRYIDNHLGERLRVVDLARIAGLESSHFAELFSRAAGLPPAKYIVRRRIEQARAHLRTSDVTLVELAEQLGFSDAFHLSRTFRRLMGMSPDKYRRTECVRP